MLFLLIVIALGFFPKQEKRYWVYAASAIALQTIAQLLFSAGGTVEDSAGDGYITAMVRQSTKSDVEVLWIFPFAMILMWVIPIYLIYKGYVRKTKSTEEIDKTE
jgi:hypothetical protein